MFAQLITSPVDGLKRPHEKPHALVDVQTTVDETNTVRTKFIAVTHHIEVVEDDGRGNVSLKVVLD